MDLKLWENSNILGTEQQANKAPRKKNAVIEILNKVNEWAKVTFEKDDDIIRCSRY